MVSNMCEYTINVCVFHPGTHVRSVILFDESNKSKTETTTEKKSIQTLKPNVNMSEHYYHSWWSGRSAIKSTEQSMFDKSSS